ncbi:MULTISPECIES: hypothetical protein [Cyanophyceae]|uniref:hypothetical protein n=1 Tax=Cyanophyceae TaxID=3028117 RepID=UPI0016833335|nr:hypothetical protein [Trichocoleus sp. FACHB-69]MBD1934310.1 hypothetical protein [Trichocoleus sp. FACHB-69]
MSDKSLSTSSINLQKKFIRVGNRIINPDMIATADLSGESVIIILKTHTEERLEFSGGEAKALQEYFSNPSRVDRLPPQRPPLEAI